MSTTRATVAGDPFPQLLFIWLSPGFPTGAYAYSQGLEMAVERGLVRDRVGLVDWLAVMLAHGALHNDLLLLAEAHRAVCQDDAGRLGHINDLALALQPSAERMLETTQQGGSFLGAVALSWPLALFARHRAVLTAHVAYPVAVGLATAAHDVPLAATLHAFALATISALTSAAVRLGIVAQTGAQMAIAELTVSLGGAVGRALEGTLDDLGSAALSADLCSLEHETQYSRLFRS